MYETVRSHLMHGRLDDVRRAPSASNERQALVHSALLLLVEGEAATSDHLRDLIAKLPAAIAFVVRREIAEAHLPILSSLMASGAVFSGAPVHGDLIRPGHVYLLDQGISLGRYDGKFVLNQPLEPVASCVGQEMSCSERLTIRQREILRMVIDGEASKRIAASLRISQRTVENHRAAIMRRLGVRTLAALVRKTVAG